MNVKNVEKENGSAKVTVEIAKDEFQTALDKAYAKIRKDIMIPGFRKGKAPRKFVERMYGSQVFYEDAVNEIFPDIYEAAIVKQELKAVGQPSVTDMQTPEDGSVVLTVSTELYPEVTLGEYKGIEVPKETVSISKAEVDAELSRMQERNARIETVDREAKTGDTVVLDFEGFVDGKPFDGGKAEGYTLTLGSGAFIPGFEDQLVGSRPGDEVRVHVTFPAQYHAPELAGKDAEFVCKVHEIRESGEYGSQDEFAKAVGCGSYDDLRAQVRENLRRYYDQRAEMELQDKLMRQAAATLDYTPSEAELHEAVEQQIQTMEAQLAQRGLRLEDYCKFAGATPESLREDARADAEQALRMQKAVDRIAILEGLRASQKDLDDAMQVIARENGLSLDQLKGYCDDNFNRAVENSVLSTKAYALVRALADVTEITVGGQK